MAGDGRDPAMSLRVLLLAGTLEARHLALALGAVRGLTVMASLAGPARAPNALGVATRIGGFGGEDGFRDFLDRERIGAVLDATHPFAARISARSARICGDLRVPYGLLLRPAWRPQPGDRWHFAQNEADAARQVPEGATAFLATGRMGLDAFGTMPGRRVYVRQLDRRPDTPVPFEDGDWVVGRPPFPVEAEAALFRRLGVEWLVVRNAGGSSSRTKLDAARKLAIDVAMIRRPPQPESIRFDTVSAAILWVRRMIQ